MMCRLLIAVLAIVTSISGYSFAADETLTITTYYPSPYGYYNELSTNILKLGTPSPVPLCNASNPDNEGKVYYDSNSHTALYCNGQSWTAFSGGGVYSNINNNTSSTYSTTTNNDTAFQDIPGSAGSTTHISKSFRGGVVSVQFFGATAQVTKGTSVPGEEDCVIRIMDGNTPLLTVIKDCQFQTDLNAYWAGNLSAGSHDIHVEWRPSWINGYASPPNITLNQYWTLGVTEY